MESVCVSGVDTIKKSHNSEDIVWSSSESDCDISPCVKHQTPTTKTSQIRKHKNTKKRTRNHRNLDVTVIPVLAPFRQAKNTSPVFGFQKIDCPSPVLTPFNSAKGKHNPAQICNSSLEADVIQEPEENGPPSPVLTPFNSAKRKHNPTQICNSSLEADVIQEPEENGPPSPVLTPFNSAKGKHNPTQICNSSLEADVIQEPEENGPPSPVLTPFNSAKGKHNPTQICNSSFEADVIQEPEKNGPPSPVLSCKSLTKNSKQYRNIHSFSKDPKTNHMVDEITSPNMNLAFGSKRPLSPALELLNSSAERNKENHDSTGTASKLNDVSHGEDKRHNTFIGGSGKITPIVDSKHYYNVKSPILPTKSSSVPRCKKKLMTDIEIILNSPTAKEEGATNSSSNDQLSPILSTKRMHPDLRSPPPEVMVKKIKSYFDSHFSSQSISQASINDSTSQSQIPASQSQIPASQADQKFSNTQIKIEESHSSPPTQDSSGKIISVSSEKTSPSKPSISDVSSTSKVSIVIKTESEEALQPKRRRCKKDGLVSRLRVLLKKQKNQISLWQHEMYLASNSNFVVPSSSPYRLFAIEKIRHKYGSYLIEAVDLANKLDYLVLLSLNFECNIVVTEKSVLKLYEPYEVIEKDSKRFIIRACKFECLNIKEEKSEGP